MPSLRQLQSCSLLSWRIMVFCVSFRLYFLAVFWVETAKKAPCILCNVKEFVILLFRNYCKPYQPLFKFVMVKPFKRFHFLCIRYQVFSYCNLPHFTPPPLLFFPHKTRQNCLTASASTC